LLIKGLLIKRALSAQFKLFRLWILQLELGPQPQLVGWEWRLNLGLQSLLTGR